MAKKIEYTKHPSVYITSEGTPTLTIFSDFFREEGLPKYEQTPKKNNKVSIGDGALDGSPREAATTTDALYALVGGKIVPRQLTASPRWVRDTYIQHAAKCEAEADRILKERDDLAKKSKLGRALAKFFGKHASEDEVDALITFDKVKQAVLKELPTTAELEKACKDSITVIEWLEKTGQHGQAERLIQLSGVVAGELVLMRSGYGKYVTKDELIDFLLKSERGVRVDFLRYYPEILPKAVADKVEEANKLLVFDNYVVLYYSRTTPKFVKTERDVVDDRKRRDPILFGMIEGSNRLYYVTDWITQDDDLTLAKMEKVLGRSVPELNDSVVATSSFTGDQLARMAEELEQQWIEEHEDGAPPSHQDKTV